MWQLCTHGDAHMAILALLVARPTLTSSGGGPAMDLAKPEDPEDPEDPQEDEDQHVKDVKKRTGAQ